MAITFSEKTQQVLVGIGLVIIGFMCGIAFYANIYDEGGLFRVEPEIRLRAIELCAEQGYRELESVRFIKQHYYQIRCSRISEHAYEIKEFDMYPEELIKE